MQADCELVFCHRLCLNRGGFIDFFFDSVSWHKTCGIIFLVPLMIVNYYEIGKKVELKGI